MAGQPIVVGVDGSPESGIAAGAGCMLAQAARVDCRLVHAARDARALPAAEESVIAVEAMAQAMRARARRDVVSSLAEHVPPGVTDQLLVRPGRPAAVLDAVIADTDAQLLVLGGKHHSALGRWLGGSTVQHMVRRLRVPLLVTTNPIPQRARVMVAVDVSYAAHATIDRAVAFAQLVGGPLHALHVIEPAVTVPEAAFLPDPGDRDAWSRERAERDFWPLLPIPDHHKVVRRGPATPTIAQEAAAWHADVIVVGSHGKRWIDRLLIGSVTEELLSDLPAAVLVIPVPAPVRPHTLPIRERAAPAPA